MRRLVIISLLLGTACGGGNGQPSSEVLVVATTSVLGDVVANLVGNDARVEVIMPVGADPHDFEPSAQQAELLRQADLVVANGLGLEEGLIDLIEAAEQEGANILELAPLLDPLPFAGHGEDEHQGEAEGESESEEDHGLGDPHFWQDPVRMAQAVEIIASRLAELETDLAPSEWSERAATYGTEILAAHAANEALLAAIPVDQRKLVTNHEAFGYFADRYGFEIIGVVIPGGSTLGEPSAQDLAHLVEEMRHEGVRAIFAENTNPAALADAVAAELGEAVTVVELYSDSLAEPGSPADTYLGLIEENARLVAEALT
ncbi:MAG TPA: metal ABC transporter substrate-binding protein [Acidimicrobiia bacterium]|nr:metal ABC transporter substrate-binding protein [Acidimicrobiia bacterium]